MTRLEQRGDCAQARAGRLVAVGALVILAGWALEARSQTPDKSAPEKTAPDKATPEKPPPLALGVIPPGTYLEMPIDPPEARGWARALSFPLNGPATQMLMNNEVLDPPTFDKFFNKVLFPQFTIYSVDAKIPGKAQTNVLVIDAPEATDPRQIEQNLTQRSRLPKMRTDFIQKYLQQGASPEAFTHLEDLAIISMSEIALKNYHPLARYNAVLLMGSLYPHGQKSELYPKAWKPMVDCLDSIGPVKVAAMSTIMHHAKSVPADQLPQMLDRLQKIASDKTVGKGESPEAHDWIRRKAVETIAAIGEKAASPKIVAELVGIVNDPQAPVELACAAARALGSMPANALGTADLSALAGNVGRVAVVAVHTELGRAEQRAFAAPLPVLNGGASSFGPGRRSAADQPTDEPPPPGEQYISIPLLKTQLQTLDLAFKGTGTGTGLTAAANGTNYAPKVAKVAGGLTEVIALCDATATEYAPLKAKLEKGADTLEEKLGAGIALPATATPGKAAAGSDPFGAADTPAPADAGKTAPAKTPPPAKTPMTTPPAAKAAGK